MYQRAKTWKRAEEDVKFKGFTNAELNLIKPTLENVDKYLKPGKKLNTEFKLGEPKILRWNNKRERVAAETRYLVGGKAKVYVNPIVFNPQAKQEWNPGGVVAHEIGHLVGPTRSSTKTERQSFRKAFSYRQKRAYHEFAPQEWAKRRDNPLKEAGTRQAVDASEDFAETFRTLVGEPFTNRATNYFNVETNKDRLAHMQKYVLR